MTTLLSNRIFAAISMFILLVPASLNVLAYAETRDIKDFSQIGFSISGSLTLVQGETFRIVISGSEEDVKKVITTKENNYLNIKSKPGVNDLGDINITVTLPKLEKLDVAGSGDVFSADKFTSESIKISITGSGDVDFKDLSTGSASLVITGSGDIDVKGSCSAVVKVEITGSGEVNSSELKAKDAIVHITGSGTARVFAGDNLESHITGSGNVYYKGQPLVNAKSTGSGSTRSM